MPRHIEQPARRHSKPAAVKIRSRPSSSACCFTAAEPGTTIARTDGCTRLPRHDRGRGAQVLDPRVRAGADEDAVDRDVRDLRAGLETHVRESPLDRVALSGSSYVRRVRHLAVDRHDHLRVRPPRDLRRELRDVDVELAVEAAPVVGRQ